jgi:DNA-binding NarL/FixJ family response regulator
MKTKTAQVLHPSVTIQALANLLLRSSPEFVIVRPMLNVLLADDHLNMRVAISELLKSYADVRLVAEARSFREVIDRSFEFHPDVVLMDVHMGDERKVKPSDLKTGLINCQLLAMSLWTDEATKVLAKSFGAFMLLDKTKLGSELLPSLKLCAQRRSAYENQQIQAPSD